MKNLRKKLMAILFISISVCCITSCGSKDSSEKMTNMQFTSNNMKTTQSFSSKGDHIQKVVTNTEIDLSSYDEKGKDAYKKLIEKNVSAFKEKIKDLDFAKEECNIVGDKIIENVEMDLSTPEKVQALIKAQVLPINIDPKDADKIGFISLKQSVEQLEKQGWTKKAK